MADGSLLQVRQETDYPWQGAIKIEVEACKNDPFEILLRIPDWCTDASIRLNGETVDEEIISGNYFRLLRPWRPGDIIFLDLSMPVQLIEGHPRIEEVRNQVAIKRGPMVYCIESPDLPAETDNVDVYISGSTEFKIEHAFDQLAGVTTIVADVLIRKDKKSGLYRPLGTPHFEKHSVRFVPYFAWSNRGTSEMTVFLPLVFEKSHQ